MISPQEQLCLCGCGQPVEQHSGKGRPSKYATNACKTRAFRNQLSTVTKIQEYDVTKITNTILCGDSLSVLQRLPDKCVQMCVTSPPYFQMRDYGVSGQIGLEDTPQEFVAKLVDVFREVRRVLKDNGICWCNIGDTFAGGTLGRRDSGTEGKFGGPRLTPKDRAIP